MPKKIYNSFTSFLPPVNCDEAATRLPSVAAEILFPVHSTILRRFYALLKRRVRNMQPTVP